MIVLASGSGSRRALLTQAGVPFTVAVAAVDETAVKQAMAASGAAPGEVAETLAELKAARVSPRHPGAVVIGADQMLDCDGAWYDKPESLEAARTQLRSLRGRTHRLTSAVVAVRDGVRLWHCRPEARLTMRAFSDTFLDSYLDRSGEDLLGAVGCYRLEGLGVQLFARVEGDHSTILGLPLLPLLDFLRENGELPS